MIFYFGFHPPASLRECIARREWMMFGHVEAWGVNADRIAFFLDPRADRARLTLTSDMEQAADLMARRLRVCERVLRYEEPPHAIAFPFHPTMTCVSQCAALIGVRAYTPRAFARILLAKGATEVGHDAERGPRNQGRPAA